MVSLLKDQLGEESKREMEKMLAQGVPMEEVIQHFISHGKTAEEEEIAVAEKLKNICFHMDRPPALRARQPARQPA